MKIERLATRAGMRVFSQGGAVYRGAGVPGGVKAGVRAVLDRNFEVYEEDQLARRTTVMSLLVSEVPRTHDGQDTIERDGRVWHVDATLDDDGYERVVEVS